MERFAVSPLLMGLGFGTPHRSRRTGHTGVFIEP